MIVTKTWGCSSVGRALEWHSRGQGFDSPHLHQILKQSPAEAGFFCIVRLKIMTHYG